MRQTATDRTAPGRAETFERVFADDADLGRLSYAARRILAMSAALFYRDGAAATSVRDITSACGLSPGALYRHFASKDDVLDLLVRNGHDRLEEQVRSALHASDDDPRHRLAAFVRAYVTAHLEQPEMAQLVRREYRHLSGARYQDTVRRRRRLRRQLAEILSRGAHDGVLDLADADRPASTDTAEAAIGVAIMVLDMCSRTSEWYNARRSDPPAVLAERYVTAALRLAGAAG